MKAVRCSRCGLRVGPAPNQDYGDLAISTPGNHEPVELDGFALLSELAVCPGSEMLGQVIDLEDHSLDHVIYDGYGYHDKDGNRIGSTRP